MGDPWRDVMATSVNGPFKVYVNRDASPQQQRIGALLRTLKYVITQIKPEMRGKLGTNNRPHPQRKQIGFLSHDLVDVVAVWADTKDCVPTFRFDPPWMAKHGLDNEDIKARVLSASSARSPRVTDTSQWLG